SQSPPDDGRILPREDQHPVAHPRDPIARSALGRSPSRCRRSPAGLDPAARGGPRRPPHIPCLGARARGRAERRRAPAGPVVVGDGGLDLLFLTGWITQIEQLWDAPANRRFLERLAAFGRLILFDSRGTGLSDRVLVEYTVEQETQDALAVLDAAGSERAAVF